MIRVRQWIKNTLVFSAVVFSQKYGELSIWIESLLAFISFCFAASFVYVINDLMDLEQDRLHPVKQHRPIASGTVSQTTALIVASILLIISLSLGYLTGLVPLVILIGYIVVMIAYSFGLKHVFLLDILIIAAGLTTRAVYGAFVIEVEISHWLLICAFLISLLLALAKRRQEVDRVDGKLYLARKSLHEAPSVDVWDRWINMIAGITILAYILYTVDASTVAKIGSRKLLFSTPFVIYALFRYLATVQSSGEGEDPTETLLADPVMLGTIAGWLVVIVLLLAI